MDEFLPELTSRNTWASPFLHSFIRFLKGNGRHSRMFRLVDDNAPNTSTISMINIKGEKQTSNISEFER